MASLTIAGIHLDPHWLWATEDREFVLWLQTVLDRVARINKAMSS